MECCSKFRDCFLREWFQLKKLMLLRFPSFQNDSLKRFVSLSTSPSRRKFLLRRRERLFVIIRNIFVCSIFHHTARRLKHRCTEKKKKKEGKKSFSILRIWWTFQERSNGRATLHEGRDDLQLVNLCVPPRSTIVVSKFNSRDSIAFNKHQKWTSIRTTKRKSRGGKKKKIIKTTTVDCTLKNHSFERFLSKLFSSHFFSIIFASSSVCTWTLEGRGLWLVSIREDWQNEPQNNTHGLRTQKKTRRNNGTALIRFGEENRWG